MDELAAALLLEHRHHGMGKEEVADKREVDQLLPVGKAQLIDAGAGLADDRAAADRVDQDVDRAELARDRRDERVDLGGIERITDTPMRPPAGRAYFRDDPVETLLLVVN